MPRNRHKTPDQKVLETLEKYFKGGETLIIGVSGGPDSVFLLNNLITFNSKLSKSQKLNIIVAHVNHSLRGLAADLDTAFVKDLAKRNHLEFHSTKLNIGSLAKKAKKSIEETGRDFRYNFLHELYKKEKATFILTAHHADDNLETVLFNFTRGGSLTALSGMKEIHTKNNGDKLLRPLLCLTKEEILDYLKKKHITYRTDGSNSDTTISRNFIRHEIIPQLKTLNPNLAQTVLNNSQTISEIQKYLEEEAERWINENNLSKPTKNIDTFDLKSFAQLSSVIQKEIIRLIYTKKEGSTKNIEKTHIEEVLSVIKKNIGNKSKKLGKYKVEIKRGTFIMKPCQF